MPYLTSAAWCYNLYVYLCVAHQLLSTPQLALEGQYISNNNPNGLQGQYMSNRDLSDFFKEYLANYTVGTDDVVSKYVGDQDKQSGQVEASLDIQYMMGVAPGIKSEFWLWNSMDFCGVCSRAVRVCCLSVVSHNELCVCVLRI